MGILILFFACYTDFRGVWIPRWSVVEKENIFYYLDGKFNHIFLQIFALGEAYYPSKYTPSKVRTSTWLQEFLNEAHRRNIKVSAWINVFYSWGYAPKAKDPRHAINCQSDWYVHDKSGRSILDYDITKLKDLGIEGYFLSPSNIQVRAFITRVILEIISKYAFDGIHLDYIRYPNSEFIYDVSLRTKFMRRYYVDPIDLFTKSEPMTRFSLWGSDDLKMQWREFIYNDLTMFIKNLRDNIKKFRPEIQISAAVKPNYLTARFEYCQDWTTWLDSNFVDFVCLMAYNKNIEKYLDKIIKKIEEPHRVMVGLGLYLLTPKQIKDQVELVRSKSFSGVVFFSYDQLKKNSSYLESLK